MTNQQLLAAVRRKKADDKVKVKLSRAKELVELEMTLAKKPQTRGQQNPFSGTLGGQAENLQDQQGDKGFENGGVYMSKDGGKVWERINSLNPRPMYYSQVRVDPVDRRQALPGCGRAQGQGHQVPRGRPQGRGGEALICGALHRC